MAKKRYAAFTNEQQATFDKLALKHQKYVLFRAQGMTRSEAYAMAGFKSAKNGRICAMILETKTHPEMEELIIALGGQSRKIQALKEDTPISKEIDKKAKELDKELATALFKVDENSAYVEKGTLDIANISVEQAKNIQFFRKVANGEYKNRRITKKYDGEGKLLSTTVEESSDLDTRIKAQKEVMRMVGIDDVLEIGQVEAQNINIMIVDATLKEGKEDSRNDIDFNKAKLEEDGTIIVKEEIVEGEDNGK